MLAGLSIVLCRAAPPPSNYCTPDWEWEWLYEPWLTITGPGSPPDCCVGEIWVGPAIVSTAQGMKWEVDMNGCPQSPAGRNATPVQINPQNSWCIYTGPVGTTPVSGSGTTAHFTTIHGGTVVVEFATQASVASPPWEQTAGVRTQPFRVFEVSDLTVLNYNADCESYVFDDQDPNKATVLTARTDHDIYGSGWLNLRADPNPPVESESELPSGWTLTGGQVLSKRYARVDRSLTGTTTVRAQAGTSYKERMVLVYKAVLQVQTDEADHWWELGHSWWRVRLEPAGAVAYLEPELRPYLDFGGYWPVDGSKKFLGGEGEVRMGNAAAVGGHSTTESGAWEVCWTPLCVLLSIIKDLDDSPGNWWIPEHTCSTVAVEMAGYVGVSGLNGGSPWWLHDSLVGVPDNR